MTKEKVTYICSVSCPKCKEQIDVLKKVTVITPAEPAEKEESFVARSANFKQPTLEEAEKAKETEK